MTQEQRKARGLRRDAGGRLATVGDLLGAALAGLVVSGVVLLVFEAIMALTGVGAFGESNGWFAVILPVWLFIEEFRAEAFGAPRIMVVVLAAGFGAAFGMTVAGLAASVTPSLVSGAAGAATATVVYSLVWFYGLRWLSDRNG
ncbi:hypothetical protein [Actinoplanes sp. NPDC051851]|uniref:hypothetical protein n=1 Tax=Actinoplanes sp. NPDC051851 TaxID=3154753 RepID=UPI00343C8E75